MLLHYPQQLEYRVLPTHYQSYNDYTNISPRDTNLPSSTTTTLPHRSSQSIHRSMHTPQQNSNPTVHIHQSTPSPGHGAQSGDSQPMLAQSAFLGSGWGNEGFPSSGYLNTLPRKTGRYHKRLSSGSSATSAGPPSPLDHTATYCQIVNSDSSHFPPSTGFENYDCMSTPPQNHLSKSLPTPVGTPTSNTFMQPGYQNVAASQDNHRHSASASRRIQSTSGDDDAASFAFSGPQSVSSMSHNSPATPHTNYDTEYDEKNNFGRGETSHSDIDKWMDQYLLFDPGYPQSAAFSQAMQDVFPDQIYNTPTSQSFPQQSQQNMPHTPSHLSPYRNMSMFANRLQAANQDHLSQRTSSPATSVPRERSPFNPYNNMQELGNDGVSRTQMTAITQAMMEQPQAPTAPKSVSPKELMLDDPEVDDADTTPLFPEHFDQTVLPAHRRQSSNMAAFRDQNGMYIAQPFSAAPSQVPQQYPFISNRRRQPSSLQTESDQLPEFPAHMVSMETTVEEGPSEPSSSQQSSHQPQHSHPIQRPDDTSSDSGTYTCTYHGCTLRFETPARLQKHKREAHRQTSPTSGPTSAPGGPANIGLRNSQAGPHKCERTNPSTGKPCNSIFSRPYDLTRHEDTIHNARKQKVRCHLCTEEKTFSRNDALTRHMRVVHPDVDWPGKTRRGKGRD
jgi:Zinc finger, C2H2 type